MNTNKHVRRFVTFALVLAVLFTALPLSVFASPAAAGTFPGDANRDGRVDLLDVLSLEKYLAGETGVTINESNADVNADGLIDEDDVWLIREYLVGNIANLPPGEFSMITFQTDGGSDVAPIVTATGFPIKKTIPSPSKAGMFFAGWVKEDGSPFYKEEPVLGDMLLTATYGELETAEVLSIDSFSINSDDPYMTLEVEGDFEMSDDVWEFVTLIVLDGSSAVAASISQSGVGLFEIGASGGFRKGGSYALTLGEGLTFTGQDPSIRTANILISKEEQDNLVFSDELIFIKDTDEMSYALNNRQDLLDVLDFALIDGDDLSGTFMMSGGNLNVGDLVCIYENVHPESRDYTTDDYADDSIAYIRITGADAGTYTFTGLTSEDLMDILFMPECVPYSVTTLPTETELTVSKSAYDTVAWDTLGFTDPPKFRINDFLVFYNNEFTELSERTEAVYAQITDVTGDVVSYRFVSLDDLENYSDLYVVNDVETEEYLANIEDVDAFLSEISAQVEASDFVNYASEYMLASALQTDSLRSQLFDKGFSEAEISKLPSTFAANAAQIAPTAAGSGGSRAQVKLESGYPKVSASLTTSTRFGKGFGLTLTIQVILSVEKQISAQEVSQLKIDLTASFTQEISTRVIVEAKETWDFFVIIPYIEQLYVSSSVDIKNYTYVSVCAKIYTKTKEQYKWDQLKSLNDDPVVQERLRQINALQAQAEQLKKQYGNTANELLNQAQGLYDALKQTYGVDFQALEKDLGMENIGEELSDVLNADNPDNFQVGLDQLMDKYAEMLKNETDWVKLFEHQIADLKFDIYKLVVGSFTITFLVRANVNISLGAEVEYQVGKRYNFWFNFDAKNKTTTSGSEVVDILDEQFGFQFYVMGSLGLRAGIQLELKIGIISTDLASIGATVEFGPYLRLWGYFIYVYTKRRPAGQSEWFTNQEMMGAMYLEFGIYLLITAKAQVFDDMFKYEPTLLDKEFPLLEAGTRKNVYDFGYTLSADDKLYIMDADANSSNGITMYIPQSYRLMKNIDLREGAKSMDYYPGEKFHYTSDNPYITVDEYGLITVTPPVSGIQDYIPGNITLTWKSDKLAFSVYDISITIPVVWTNMSLRELTEKYMVSVAAGNNVDAFPIVWSERFGYFDKFDLPTDQDILTMVGYYDYMYNNINLKYSSTGTYDATKTTGITGTLTDHTFTYTIPVQEYELIVSGIQNDDGSTATRTYRTSYNKQFNLSDLAKTGTDDSENGEYTAFLNLTLPDGEIFDPQTVVNLAFIEKYGTSVNLTANYADISRTATFSFIGIDADDVVITFKKGTVPDYSWLIDYINGHGGEGMYVTLSSPITVAEHSLTYKVFCSVNDSVARYYIIFVTNGGTEISNMAFKAGEPISGSLDQAVTTLKGHDFVGWYEREYIADPGDEETIFNEVKFDYNAETVMPEQDIKLFARWNAIEYTVTYDDGGTEPFDTQVVTYDSKYKPPTPGNTAGSVFGGWYTQPNGAGTLINSGSIFQETSDQTLYAYWKEIITVNFSDWIEYDTPQSEEYDPAEPGYAFKFSLTEYATDLGLDLEDFVVMYRWEGSNPLTEDYTTDLPTQGGRYNVKIDLTEEAKEEYQWPTSADGQILQPFIQNALEITPISMGLSSTTQAFSVGNVVVIQRPEGAKAGNIIYRLGNYHNTTGVFHGITEGSWVYRVDVEGDRNYQPAGTEPQTVPVTGLLAGGYRVNLKISVGNNGTDCKIWGAYVHSDLTHSPSVVLLDHGGNDFEEDSTYIYNVANYVMPWEVAGFGLIKEYFYFLGATDDLVVSNVDVIVENINTSVKHEASFYGNHKLSNENPRYSGKTSNFKREILDSYGFYNGDNSIVLDDAVEGTPYKYYWSGCIKDQYYDIINVFQYYGVAYYYVSAMNGSNTLPDSYIDEYNQFLKFTDTTAFEIDSAKLRDYMLSRGRTGPENDFVYIVEVSFKPESLKSEQPYYMTKYIAVTAPSAPETQDVTTESLSLPDDLLLTEPETYPNDDAQVDPNDDAQVDPPVNDPQNPADGENGIELAHNRKLPVVQTLSTASVSAQRADLFSPTGIGTVLDSANDRKTPALQPLSTATYSGNLVLSTGSAFQIVAGDTSPVGNLLDVPITISGTAAIWGVWADVTYNRNELKLLGCTYGNVFTSNMINVKNDRTASPFTFLATCEGMQTTDANGTILTLHFEVQPGAQSHNVSVSTRQVIADKGIPAPGAGTNPISEPTASPPSDISDTVLTSFNGLTITTPDGYPPVVAADGTVTLPGGGVIETEDGLVFTLPADTVISADGKTITVPHDGGTVKHTSESVFNLLGDIVIFLDGETPLGYYIQTQNPFTDMAVADWFYDAVMFNLAHRLMTGTGADTFSPQSTLTRGMVVTVLWRLAGSPAVTGNSNPFSDVPAGSYFTDPIIWAAANGIVNGYGDGKFEPDDSITRQDLTVILSKYAVYANLNIPEIRDYTQFTDEAEIAEYAADAVRKMYTTGIISGYPDQTFKPGGSATRAEFATMIMNFIEKTV